MNIMLSFSLYFLSFVPLWITVLFINIKSIIMKSQNPYTEILSIIFIILFSAISLLVMKVNFSISKKDTVEKFEIITVKECKTITVEFLLSYILPLFAFDFTLWDETVEFLIFFFILAYLSIKHNVFSVNIILEWSGYKLYDCTLKNNDDATIIKTIISKNVLKACSGKYMKIKALNNDFVLDCGFVEE
ncbi:MAG: hypothetical protein IJ366_06060 [Clostridia bacterium]|nr:hypothetical protein [Clostridia bacterium]